MSIELKTPLIKRRSELEELTFNQSKDDQLNRSIASISIDNDVFPSKQPTHSFLKACLYDDLDLFDALRAIHFRRSPL